MNLWNPSLAHSFQRKKFDTNLREKSGWLLLRLPNNTNSNNYDNHNKNNNSNNYNNSNDNDDD